MNLTAANVSKTLVACLIQEENFSGSMVVIQGVTAKFGFRPDLLKKHKQDIIDLLNELPEEFLAAKGGIGWTFLEACKDKNGVQWGQQKDVDQLYCLGLAIGKIECQYPRIMWNQLIGGMPYFVVLENDNNALPQTQDSLDPERY